MHTSQPINFNEAAHGSSKQTRILSCVSLSALLQTNPLRSHAWGTEANTFRTNIPLVMIGQLSKESVVWVRLLCGWLGCSALPSTLL